MSWCSVYNAYLLSVNLIKAKPLLFQGVFCCTVPACVSREVGGLLLHSSNVASTCESGGRWAVTVQE